MKELNSSLQEVLDVQDLSAFAPAVVPELAATSAQARLVAGKNPFTGKKLVEEMQGFRVLGSAGKFSPAGTIMLARIWVSVGEEFAEKGSSAIIVAKYSDENSSGRAFAHFTLLPGYSGQGELNASIVLAGPDGNFMDIVHEPVGVQKLAVDNCERLVASLRKLPAGVNHLVLLVEVQDSSWLDKSGREVIQCHAAMVWQKLGRYRPNLKRVDPTESAARKAEAMAAFRNKTGRASTALPGQAGVQIGHHAPVLAPGQETPEEPSF